MAKIRKKKAALLSRDQLMKKIKTVCIDCTQSTMKTYANNMKRLAKLAGHEGVPGSGVWLNRKGLLKTYDKQNLSARRVLSVAAVKLSQLYNQKKPIEWTERLKKAASEYDTEREKRKKTNREKDNWPKDGYDALKRAANEFKLTVSKYFSLKQPSVKELYEIQKYVILKLYSEHALRLDWGDVLLGKQDDKDSNNYLYKHARKGWTLIMRKYKTSKFLGEQEIKISRPASLALSMFVPKVKATTKHGYLLSNKNGDKMTKSNLSKVLIRLTEKLLKKRIGSQIIRVLKATKYRKSAEENANLSKEMMHGKEQHLLYAKKD